MLRSALLAVLFCTLLVVLVTCQTCTDSCRVVCDSEPQSAGSNGHAQTVRRGKQGAKGEKGDTGSRGEKGSDSSDLVGRLENRISDLENFNEFLLKNINDQLKSNLSFLFVTKFCSNLY